MTTGHDFDERFERIDRFEDISALLDGELDPARAAQVEGWIATDPEARAEYESLSAVRQALRGLPPVEPPIDLAAAVDVEALPPVDVGAPTAPGPTRVRRHRRRRRYVAVAAGAVVVAFVVLAGVVPAADTVVPPLTAFAARHEAMVAQEPMPTDDGFAPVDMHDAEAMGGMVVPDAVGPMPAQSAYLSGDAVHATYAAQGLGLSLFEQQGVVDWSAMPDGGEMTDIDGAKAWHGEMDGMEVVVLERNDTVVTAIFQGHTDEMMTAIAEMPAPPPPSMWDRVTGGIRRLFGGS